jgi:hypothetical protein
MCARAKPEQTRSSSQVAGDRIAVRLRVAHLLNTVSLETPWLPPASTLILRKFRDPLPRRLCKDADSRIASKDWENAALSALREESLRAVRPAHGLAGAGANAVLFETPADLIACLARDLCSGDAFIRWWWRSYVRGVASSLSALLLAAFRRDPRHVPMAVAKLAEWGAADRVISQLNPSHADSLLREILFAYGLERLFTAIHPGPSESQHSGIAIGDKSSMGGPGSELFLQPSALPWEPQVSAQLTPNYLGLERRALVGISLLLARTPQRPRAAQFERDLRNWAANAAREHTSLSLEDMNTKDSPSFAGDAPRIEILPRWDTPDSAAHSAQSPDDAEMPIAPREGGSPNTNAPEVASFLLEPTSSISNSEISSSLDLDLEAGIATQLGGVLFLINLFRAFKFFSYLENSLALVSPPGPWALLELFSKCLLRHLPTDLRCDPIWLALRNLDGRGEAEPAARDFQGSAEYQLPGDWLPQSPAGQVGCLTLSSRDNRLLIRHPHGFTLLDSMAEELRARSTSHDILDRLQNTFPGEWRYGRPTRDSRRRIANLSGPVPAEAQANPALPRFLQFFSPFFRWALANSLTTGASKHPDHIAELLRRPGRLYVTSTHVDLVMDINHVTLAARLTGSDANPGWVPELGRVITFHYR